MKKNILLIIIAIFANTITKAQTFSFAGWAQTGANTYRGRTFSKDTYTFSRVAGGNTMTARLSSNGGCTDTFDPCASPYLTTTSDCFVACDCSGTGPCYGPGNNAPTNSGSSLVIGANWRNLTSFATLDLTFATGILNPSFTIYDHNTNSNFADNLIVSAVNCAGTTVFPSSVTGRAANTAYNAATGTISQTTTNGTALGNGGTNITVIFTANVTSIRIIYGSKATIPSGTNPSAQFIYVGQIVSTLSACAPLPVVFDQIEAVNKENFNEIKWSTASEVNNDYFTVEKSIDGENFKELSKIKTEGNSFESKSYSQIDNEPAVITWYRIKQTDMNGDFFYSNVTQAFMQNGNLNHIAVHPNPTERFVNITFPLLSEIVNLQCFDITGRLIFENSINDFSNATVLDFSKYQSGTYFLKFKTETQEINKKIVIK